MGDRKHIIYDSGFALLCAGLFYLMPYISWYTMEGDKGDVLMGMAFGFIPIGLFFLSVVCGLLSEQIMVPVCIACVLSAPTVLIPIVAGNTVSGRLQALLLIVSAVFAVSCVGTIFGVLVRRLVRNMKASCSRKRAEKSE